MLTVMTPAQLLELLERRFSPLDRPPEEVELEGHPFYAPTCRHAP